MMISLYKVHTIFNAMKKESSVARKLVPGERTVLSYWLLEKSETVVKSCVPHDVFEQLLRLIDGHVRQSIQSAIQESLGSLEPRISFQATVETITNAGCDDLRSEAAVELKRKIRYHVFDLLENEKGPREDFSIKDIEIEIVSDPGQISPEGRKVDYHLSDASVYAMTFVPLKKIIMKILEDERGQRDADMKRFVETLESIVQSLSARNFGFQAASALAWIKTQLLSPLRAKLHL